MTSKCSTPRARGRRQGGPVPLAVLLLVTVAGQPRTSAAQGAWGTLANRGFAGQPMKSVYFFAGNWRIPGAAFYDGPVPGIRITPASNECLYSIHPVDARHLGWSEEPANREYAVNLMLRAGVNVINMSYWGPPNTDRWAFSAPMQTAVGAHDELFDTAVGKPVLIVPYIENADPTLGKQQVGCHGRLGPVGQSPGYNFLDVFPGTPQDPAPELVTQILSLVDRYLLNPANPAWPEKWAQMYDRDGVPRYVVSLIHVGSNQMGVTDQMFAEGFTWVADRVYRETGNRIRVGFTLDALPAEHNARFKPSPDKTGPWLVQQPAVLAIQAFIPEVFTGRCLIGADCDAVAGSPALTELVTWKRDFISKWVDTGIPVILDVSPGYDARVIFPPGRVRFGNNDPWRQGQAELLSLGVRGVTANTWNGYTEGYALTPSCGVPPALLCPPPDEPSDELFDEAYVWFRDLISPSGSPARRPTRLADTRPSGGVYSDPVTLVARLTEALTGAPVTGRTVHFQLGSEAAQGSTDANGVATASVTIDQAPGVVPLVVSFAGDAEYLSVSASGSFLVTRERTAVRYTGTEAIANGVTVTLTALLADDDGQPVTNRSVTVALGSGPSGQRCAGVTDAAGVARCQLAVSQVLGPQTISVDFAGDAYYEPASATTATVVFAYLLRGAFVVGDLSAQSGGDLTFWGSRWSRLNRLSGGPAPASFKGFAGDVGSGPPHCGGAWTTRTGNSEAPSLGPLPAYMAVVVSAAIRKTAASIVGNLPQIVVLRTSTGDDSNPGHPRTGTVVAVVCGP
jgi:hypothetical protein